MKKRCTAYNHLPQFGLLERKEKNGEFINVMRTLKLLILIIWGLGGLASCKQDDISATTSTLVANVTDINTYAISKGISGSYTASNLYFALTKASSSTALVSAAYKNELEFTYKLYVLSGPSNSTVTSPSATSSTVVTDKLVDTTYAKTPTFISFFAGILKAGLEEGLLKMHEGESAILLMPSSLAFGNVASSDGLIPANSPVRYDVTLNRSRTETQQLDEYAATTGLSFTTKSSGLRFVMTKTNPASDTAYVKNALEKGLVVTIRYVARQLHAKTAIYFDSTTTSGIPYNTANFISGVNEAISYLRVGERATVLFPSSLGYSTTGLVVGESDKTFKVAPYAPLRYDIEVVSAR